MLGRALLPTVLVLLFFSSMPFVAAYDSTVDLEWSADLGEGYITTSPLVVDESVYVRTSGFWVGEARPQVFSFTLEGEERWNRTSQTTTQHDMSPLNFITGGEGPCGSWPDMLLVGWANGEVEAIEPDTGVILWNRSSLVDAWGITGNLTVQNDHALVPTRTGMMGLCLADGSVLNEHQLGHGWRNGGVLAGDAYWQGDEHGSLWQVNLNGSVVEHPLLEGMIRHPPRALSDSLLLHVQHSSNSSIVLFNLSTLEFEVILVSGPSPGIPAQRGDHLFFIDGTWMTEMQCQSICEVIQRLPATSNGETSWSPNGDLWFPRNTQEGGWYRLASEATELEIFSTALDGYGTAAPEFVDGSKSQFLLGNDQGVLMMFGASQQNLGESFQIDWMLNFISLVFIIVLTSGAFLTSRSDLVWGWRLSTLCFLAACLMVTPAVSQVWSSSLTPETPESTSGTWNEDWPDTWLGTQIVVFEFEEGTQAYGGFVGHDTVLQLTMAAVDEAAIDIKTESTDLGLYVVEIDGQSGGGWEYFINDQRAVLSADRQSVDSTTVLQWRLA